MTERITIEGWDITTAQELFDALEEASVIAGNAGQDLHVVNTSMSRMALVRETLSDGSHVFNLYFHADKPVPRQITDPRPTLEPSDKMQPYTVTIDYQTPAGNAAQVSYQPVMADDEDAAIEIAHERLRADGRRKGASIQGGTAEPWERQSTDAEQVAAFEAALVRADKVAAEVRKQREADTCPACGAEHTE